MPKYKLRLPSIDSEEKSVRMFLKLPASLKHALDIYALAIEAESGTRPALDVLAVKMLGDYMAGDKAFEQFKKEHESRSSAPT